MDTVVERRNEIAAQVGIEPDRIGRVKIELDFLRKQGLLVNLDISGTGMFARTATYLEMGWGDEDKDARRTKMGRAQKYLIPDERIKELRSIETRMRQLLDKCSYKVTGFSPYRWLPVTAYKTFKSDWEKLTEEFSTAKWRIHSNLEQYRNTLASEMREVAEAAWKSVDAVTNTHDGGYVEINGNSYNHDEFIELVMDSALNGFPSTEKIENELYADYKTALVYGEQDVARDQAEAERIRKEAAEADRVEHLQSSILHEQARHELALHQIEEQERQVALDAMFAAEAEHARGQLNEIASPFAEVFKSLRSQIAKDASEILESIQKNGFVRGKVAERGRGLINLFDLLAVQDDKELRERLVNLRSAIGPVGDERTSESVRDTNEVKGILEQIVELERTAVEDLLAGPSRFSLIE
jgi:hypothetical protein